MFLNCDDQLVLLNSRSVAFIQLQLISGESTFKVIFSGSKAPLNHSPSVPLLCFSFLSASFHIGSWPPLISFALPFYLMVVRSIGTPRKLKAIYKACRGCQLVFIPEVVKEGRIIRLQITNSYDSKGWQQQKRNITGCTLQN